IWVHAGGLNDVLGGGKPSHPPSQNIVFARDAAHKPLVAMAGVDDGTVPFGDEPPACLRAHDAHAAGDQDLHAFPILGSRVIAFDVPQTPPPLEKAFSRGGGASGIPAATPARSYELLSSRSSFR